MRNIMLSLLVANAVGSGCSGEPATSDLSDTSSSTSISQFAGFSHTLQRSRFHAGLSLSARSEHGMQKLVGDQGVFAVRPTGLVVAILNADAVGRSRPPLTLDADVHNDAVKDYFVRAGLPPDQLFAVEANAVMANAGSGDADPAVVARGKLEYYFSKLTRHIGGVPVVDSFAWARLNSDGDSVMESVYWPPLAADLVGRAQTLTSRLQVASVQTAISARVGKNPGRVVVHHTPGEWNGAFSATVSYDVDMAGGLTLHFDADGRAFDLPEEAPDAWGVVPVTPRKN